MELNEQQQAFVHHREGPAALLAVPGSGKTTTMVYRTAALIASGVSADRILTLTFTKAAANDMVRRYTALFGYYGSETEVFSERIRVGPKASEDIKYAACLKHDLDITESGSHDPFMSDDMIPSAAVFKTPSFSTIHSFSLQLIRYYCHKRRRPMPKVLAESGKNKMTKSSLLAQIYRDVMGTGIGDDVLEAMSMLISLLKNTMDDPKRSSEEIDHSIKGFLPVYEAYERFKRENRLIDFDDMLTVSHRILSMDAGVLKDYRNRYDFIQMDEAQDSSLIQHEIIDMIAKPKNNIVLIGDEDQSIYVWRGANPSGLLGFQERFPEAKVFLMETNYRSTEAIVGMANRFIQKNSERTLKHMHVPGKEAVNISDRKQNLPELGIKSVDMRFRTQSLPELIKEDGNKPARTQSLPESGTVAGNKPVRKQNMPELKKKDVLHDGFTSNILSQLPESIRAHFSGKDNLRKNPAVSATLNIGGDMKALLALQPENPGASFHRVHNLFAQYQEILKVLQTSVPIQKPSVAILYRNNRSVYALADKLARSGIPFYLRDFKDTLFHHWLTKDLQAFFRLMLNPADTEAFAVIALKIKAYFTRETAQGFQNLPAGKSIWKAILKSGKLNNSQRIRIEEIDRRFARLAKLKPYDALIGLLDCVNYREAMSFASRTQGVAEEFLINLLNIHLTMTPHESTVAGYLDRLLQLQSILEDAKNPGLRGNSLVLSTVHSAKGLEFDRVMLVDMTEDEFPPADTANTKKGLEEERRLCYVAVTRARKDLHIFVPETCAGEPRMASRFVLELMQ